MKSIMEELLIKAQRDKSKLVLVQRTVTRQGRTFHQNFWVKPSEVKSTDRVLRGQQNLNNYLNPQVVPQPPSGVLDQAYFDYIKKDRIKALDYLLSCGIQWQQHTHAGINWMRAVKAYNDYVNSLTSFRPAQTNTTNASATNTVVQQPSAPHPSSTITQQPQTATQSKTITLTTAQQSEVDACKNGREKVAVLKKLLGNDGCIAYAKQLGVTWAENQHAAINSMRMSVELTKYFDNKDGTVSPVKQKKGDGKVGAPDGNQNAKKDDNDNKPDVVVDDKLEIPADAKEREKNLINLINNISDIEELELVVNSGFVPEDAGAKEFIKSKMLKEYDKLIRSSSPAGGGNYSYYGNTTRELPSDLMESSISKMFKGVSKKILKKSLGYSYLLESEFMYQVLRPRDSLVVHRSTTAYNDSSISHLTSIMTASREFNDYSQEFDEPNGEKFYCTSCGYGGKDAEMYKKQFDLNKEGLVRILRHISGANPELSDTVENMVKAYGKLMEKCRYSPHVLSEVCNRDYNDYSTRVKNRKNMIEAHSIISEELRSKGLTEDEIGNTVGFISNMRDVTIRSGQYFYDIKKDSNGNDVVFDLSYLKLKDGTPLTDLVNWSTRDELFNIQEKKGSTFDVELSASEYDEILALSYELVGSKLIDVNTNVDNATPLHQLDRYQLNDLRSAPISDDNKIDAVLSNLLLIMKGHDFKRRINEYIYLSVPSAANKNGTDYSGNFDYYIPRRGEYSSGKPGYEPIPHAVFKNSKEESDRVSKQLSQTITYSLDYFNKLKEYVENEGDSQFKLNRWGREYRTQEEARIFSCNINSKQFNIDKPTPAMNMLLDQLADAAAYCPQNYNSRVTTAEKLKSTVNSKSGYNRHQFKTYRKVVQQNPNNSLKALREKAFGKAKCSLSMVDDSKRKEVESIVKINFDRIGKDGKRVPKKDRVYDNRTLVFHSGVYEIKNSEMADEFQKESQRMNETPRVSFHGTSYSGACGINGVDGKFRFKSSDRVSGQKGSGSMLGEGIYAAKMVGKCCPYIGSRPYTYTSYTATDVSTPDNCSDGVIMVCDTVFGKHGEFTDSTEAKRNNKNNGGSYDSVAVGAGALMPNGGILKEYECIVTRQNMISPKYLVDCGARRR